MKNQTKQFLRKLKASIAPRFQAFYLDNSCYLHFCAGSCSLILKESDFFPGRLHMTLKREGQRDLFLYMDGIHNPWYLPYCLKITAIWLETCIESRDEFSDFSLASHEIFHILSPLEIPPFQNPQNDEHYLLSFYHGAEVELLFLPNPSHLWLEVNFGVPDPDDFLRIFSVTPEFVKNEKAKCCLREWVMLQTEILTGRALLSGWKHSSNSSFFFLVFLGFVMIVLLKI